jgi:NAD(P)-dependent dehydrogenase (short-subunit alcohol dehydrogenase family)
MTRSLALKYALHGVRVNCVAPGARPREGVLALTAGLTAGGVRVESDVPQADRAGGRREPRTFRGIN